jgi:hypothetical protein
MRLLDGLFSDVISFTKVTSRRITVSTWNYAENVVCIFSTREADDMRIPNFIGPAVGTHASAAEDYVTKFCLQTDYAETLFLFVLIQSAIRIPSIL